MRNVTAEIATASVWGLHVGSYLMASLPYLQAVSLILAIAVSIFTLKKLTKDSDRDGGKIY